MFTRLKKVSVITGIIFMMSLFFASLSNINAQQSADPIKISQPVEVGLWATKENDGVFQIYVCGQKLCGRFVGMQYTTPLPPTSKQGNSQCNFLMLQNFVRDKSGNRWSGTIFDPRNEKAYDAKIWVSSKGELKVRGYLGITLLGETHTWHRFSGKIMENCRLPDLK
ncbi:hypothetical protein COMX_09817 [Commensalibacter papalotli (ex Servin-Garciduenas et al. 2014)]|uniref:DUF2147 domain-containing protein n=2 Tax=Acetobacteraceae TaxID=433 RepID=W7DRM0_9PROT|nr:hypothetical protein COMX_09817 [Commensalibacter papalotli (ex Servin-Garciduenas et al. 2014)]CAI3955992.1 DUF2147 family (PDB:4INN) [Commensalibacter papalotli (ex Botero et al. 2024)]